MRALAIAFLLLASCDRNRGANETAIEARPAEISFDGAEAKVGPARVAHGERISWALGCRGCHGPELQGHYFYERYASNLTRDLSKYSDTEIDRVLRTGVPHGGRDLWGMPSEIFQHLSTADMRALIADLRTLKPSGQPTQAPLPWETDAKAMIAKGELRTAKDQVIHDKSIGPVDLGETYALGRYLTRVTCAECHGPDLKGSPEAAPGEPPNLIVAGGYSRDEFDALLTKGIPSGGRKFKNPLMSEVARKRFTHFTPHERDAIYAYLKARAEQPQ